MAEKLLSKSKQKEIAVARLKQLEVSGKYIQDFINLGTVTLFDFYEGTAITKENNKELAQEIQEFEERTGSLVYAVIYNSLTDGQEWYTFLIVSNYAADEKKIELPYYHGYYQTFSWVWNKTYDFNSEYGTVIVISGGGTLERVE